MGRPPPGFLHRCAQSAPCSVSRPGRAPWPALPPEEPWARTQRDVTGASAGARPARLSWHSAPLWTLRAELQGPGGCHPSVDHSPGRSEHAQRHLWVCSANTTAPRALRGTCVQGHTHTRTHTCSAITPALCPRQHMCLKALSLSLSLLHPPTHTHKYTLLLLCTSGREEAHWAQVSACCGYRKGKDVRPLCMRVRPG